MGGGMEWIELARNRDRWQVLVYAEITLRVPLHKGISWLADNRMAYQEGVGNQGSIHSNLIQKFLSVFNTSTCLLNHAF
jgi:hypothetical protein